MQVTLSRHIDKSELRADGFYDYYYDFNLYKFSNSNIIYHARSYNDQPGEAHFINGEHEGKVFFLGNTDFNTDLFIEACTYLQACGFKELCCSRDQGYAPITINQNLLKPLLICLGRVFSLADESTFFVCLKNIPGVVRFTSKPYGLLVDIDTVAFDEPSLRAMLALHHHYGLTMQALRMFETPANSFWFRDRTAFWYAAIFEPMRPAEELAADQPKGYLDDCS
jgi:hypothetical protein